MSIKIILIAIFLIVLPFIAIVPNGAKIIYWFISLISKLTHPILKFLVAQKVEKLFLFIKWYFRQLWLSLSNILWHLNRSYDEVFVRISDKQIGVVEDEEKTLE